MLYFNINKIPSGLNKYPPKNFTEKVNRFQTFIIWNAQKQQYYLCIHTQIITSENPKKYIYYCRPPYDINQRQLIFKSVCSTVVLQFSVKRVCARPSRQSKKKNIWKINIFWIDFLRPTFVGSFHWKFQQNFHNIYYVDRVFIQPTLYDLCAHTLLEVY